MELKEVLNRVPGLQKRFVYYVESLGYIQPTKVHKARIARRDYSEADARRLEALWRYYSRGYSIQAAHELSRRALQTVAYAGFYVPVGQVTQALAAVQSCPEVEEASAVYADSIDLLVKARAAQAGELYHSVVPALAQAGVTSVPIVWLAEEQLRRPAAKGGAHSMLAYVLMKTPGKNVAEVMDQLKEIPEVLEASTVYGESDIIAKVQVGSQEELDSLVMDKLHAIPAVESTRTFIVIGRLHWSRERPD